MKEMKERGGQTLGHKSKGGRKGRLSGKHATQQPRNV